MEGRIVVAAAPYGEFRLLHTHFGRLRGLLGCGRDAPAVLLAPCHAIHTFGMRIPIDVAFVDRQGRIALARRGLLPGRHLSQRGSVAVFERPSQDAPWFQAEEWVQIVWGHGIGKE